MKVRRKGKHQLTYQSAQVDPMASGSWGDKMEKFDEAITPKDGGRYSIFNDFIKYLKEKHHGS